MLLLIDAGNTRVKWALLEDAASRAGGVDPALLGKWDASGVVERDALGDLAQVWRGRQVTRVLLSNVAGEGMRGGFGGPGGRRILGLGHGGNLVEKRRLG